MDMNQLYNKFGGSKKLFWYLDYITRPKDREEMRLGGRMVHLEGAAISHLAKKCYAMTFVEAKAIYDAWLYQNKPEDQRPSLAPSAVSDYLKSGNHCPACKSSDIKYSHSGTDPGIPPIPVVITQCRSCNAYWKERVLNAHDRSRGEVVLLGFLTDPHWCETNDCEHPGCHRCNPQEDCEEHDKCREFQASLKRLDKKMEPLLQKHELTMKVIEELEQMGKPMILSPQGQKSGYLEVLKELEKECRARQVLSPGGAIMWELVPAHDAKDMRWLLLQMRNNGGGISAYGWNRNSTRLLKELEASGRIRRVQEGWELLDTEEAVYITELDIQGETLEVWRDPTSDAIFGVDPSYLDQESDRISVQREPGSAEVTPALCLQADPTSTNQRNHGSWTTNEAGPQLREVSLTQKP